MPILSLEKLLRVPHVDPDTGFSLARDGAGVFFSWNLSGQWEIYHLPLVDTEPHPAPEPVSRGEGSKFNPKQGPDGRLAYMVDFDGSENYHLFIHDLETGETRDLLPGIDYALQPNFDWSPDGREIAFLADKSGCFGAYILSVESGEIRLVLDNGHPAGDAAWSPDGTKLAVSCEMHGQDYGVFIIDLSDGAVLPLSIQHEPLNAHAPAWSSDGMQLAFHGDRHGFNDIGIYTLADDSVRWLTAGPAEKTGAAWSADGWLAYVHSEGAQTWLALCAPGGEPQRFRVDAGVHYPPQFLPDGRLVFIFDNSQHTADLWLFSPAGNRFRQLTFSLPDEFLAADLPMPREVSYPGLDDGISVPALLYTPPNADANSPAVVVIHGGPNWLYQVTWFPLLAHLVSRGWVVLAPNYRGSTGYGRDWQLANRFDLGGCDTRDVAAGAMYLAREGLADSQRIAVTGRSHGGYLTMTCLTQFPGLWAAGSAVVPFLNFFTSHANSRPDLQHWDIENMGDPQENHDLWYERSPFFFLNKVCAPVQLISGAHDPRCPASESVAARDRLLEVGCDVELLLYEDEGHVFLKMENILDADNRRVAFLARALEKKNREVEP